MIICSLLTYLNENNLKITSSSSTSKKKKLILLRNELNTDKDTKNIRVKYKFQNIFYGVALIYK